MLIKNVKERDLFRALEVANEWADGNVKFTRKDRAYTLQNGQEAWRVRLGTIDSRKLGGHRSVGNPMTGREGRRTGALCWHGWRAFLGALPQGAIVVSGSMGMPQNTWTVGEPFIDNYVSERYGILQSECCECTEG